MVICLNTISYLLHAYLLESEMLCGVFAVLVRVRVCFSSGRFAFFQIRILQVLRKYNFEKTQNTQK